VTTIVIAHRLATIAHANTIFVMHAGHVAEQGSHGELLEQRGRYFEMVEAATAH
jgi:ABC-type multidrug transport system fused ATPase/permease subunit